MAPGIEIDACQSLVGLAFDVAKPDYESRLAILRNKNKLLSITT